jgi:hypothetical protein
MSTFPCDPEAQFASASERAHTSSHWLVILAALRAVASAALSLGLASTAIIATGQIISATTGGPGWP